MQYLKDADEMTSSDDPDQPERAVSRFEINSCK